jgi:hypothetical protein
MELVIFYIRVIDENISNPLLESLRLAESLKIISPQCGLIAM